MKLTYVSIHVRFDSHSHIHQGDIEFSIEFDILGTKKKRNVDEYYENE